jgi:hypothetical protein
MMTREPAELFDIDAIAARYIEEAKLRAQAFALAVELCKWYEGGERPVDEIAVMANKIHAWFHTGKYPNGKK